MSKGLRIGNKIYPDKIICDGCRKEIKDYEEIRCSKCVNNLIAYIKKLEKELLILKNERFDKDYERIERELKV
jgi:predicted amidophosphoribosyltransferase